MDFTRRLENVTAAFEVLRSIDIEGTDRDKLDHFKALNKLEWALDSLAVDLIESGLAKDRQAVNIDEFAQAVVNDHGEALHKLAQE